MKTINRISLGLILSLALTGAATAQDTTKTTTVTTTNVEKTIQNPDGTYTVIEYPVGREVTVEFTPTNQTMTARGMARVLRTGDQTTVNVDLSDLDDANYYVYAIDPAGKTTFLGPVTVAERMGRASFNTPMNQFMLVLSPNEGLTAVDNTNIMFRSAVPQGQAIVPTMITSVADNRQVAESMEAASTYQVPLLNIPSYTKTAEIRINFSGELEGLKGKAYIDPTKDGLTKIKMRFNDMKMAPRNARFVLWASSPDGKYTKLGQVINNGKRQEAEIRSETALQDFGLLVTLEEKDVVQPTGRVFSVFGNR
jgi:uncharacterized protein (DUF2147 family)